jgi:hypothetical protein
MITPSKTIRRPLKFKTVAEMNAELDRLQTGKYKKLGNWSLPQACRHLALTIEGSLTPPPSDEPTAEETAMKQKFFGMIMGPDGMPEQLPIGNPALIPPDDCTDAEIDHLKTAFQSIAAYPHKCIKVGRCGPVPTPEVIELHLFHAAHHLSFLQPMPTRRNLNYANIDQLIADVNHLRKGCTQLGQWNLPQMCRHLTVALTNTMKPATGPATPEQLKLRPVLENAMATGKIPTGLQAPEKALPPVDCNDADIANMISAFEKAKTYAEPQSNHPRFGPLSLAEFHRMILVHAAHHLSYLIPTTDN